jgi:hypothetical protein
MGISIEAKAAYDREYRAKNKARIAGAKRLAHLADPSKQAARSAKWDELNPEKAAAAKKAWKARNPDADREYHLANLEAVKAQKAEYRAGHKVEIAAHSKVYREANSVSLKIKNKAKYVADSARIVAKVAEWRIANPEKYAAQLAKAALQPSKPRTPEQKAHHAAHQSIRCRRLAHAQPAWADRKAIDAIYLKAQQTGMHVDHIIPLKGKIVSGLHVEGNLQLLTPPRELA